MELEQFVVDAFTTTRFRGNSAAVVVVDEWPDASLMQGIAFENNLSETAFVKPIDHNHYAIRWFSPLTEVAFCGHATLAASFVLFRFFGLEGELCFDTNTVGELRVQQDAQGRVRMQFPALAPSAIESIPTALLEGLSIKPQAVLRNQQAYVAIMADEAEVRSVQSDSTRLKTLAPYDVVVTAAGTEHDFVSRYFWPANGGEEDPVTGSIHACLAPYWAERLGKTRLIAFQASARGGQLYCEVQVERVFVSGDAVLYCRAKLYL